MNSSILLKRRVEVGSYNMGQVFKNFLASKVTIIFAAIAVILLIVSFCLPPQGVIDPSVLQAGAELMGFAVVINFAIALDRGSKPSLRYKDVELTTDDSHDQPHDFNEGE